jgi:hypothetical protein
MRKSTYQALKNYFLLFPKQAGILRFAYTGQYPIPAIQLFTSFILITPPSVP